MKTPIPSPKDRAIEERASYSKEQINKAGSILKKNSSNPEELNRAMNILSDWRAKHHYPLHVFQTRLRNASRDYDKKSIVVQRLKRTSSILKKLNRPYSGRKPTMKLAQMQDIAGCRAIVKNVKIAREIYETHYSKGNLKHRKVREKDYVASPKSDGYRSFHLVYEYKSDKRKTKYNGMLVEVQIRSKLQHLWATSVETVDFFTRNAIKLNQGDAAWADFFRLVSSAFAIKEKCTPVENISKEELYAKIKEKESELSVITKLESWAHGMNFFHELREKEIKSLSFFLFDLDISNGKLLIQAYASKEQERTKAFQDYLKLEKNHRNDQKHDIVLVGADTMENLRKAYPNYFADTKDFVSELKKTIQTLS